MDTWTHGTDMDSRIGPLFTCLGAQELWYEEKVVIMYPNKIAWLEDGGDTFGEHLICLCAEMNAKVGGQIEFDVPVHNEASAHLPMRIL